MRLPANLVYRLGVTSRALAAIIGGYAFAAAGSALLAQALMRHAGVSRADATLSATLASFAFYTGAVLYVFAARSAARAWLGLALPGAAMAGLLALMNGGAS